MQLNFSVYMINQNFLLIYDLDCHPRVLIYKRFKNDLTSSYEKQSSQNLAKDLASFFFSFLFLFCCFTSQVNSYGHGGTVSSPNHSLLLGKLEQAVNQYFVHLLSLVTDNKWKCLK